jgi:hypothetical protein
MYGIRLEKCCGVRLTEGCCTVGRVLRAPSYFWWRSGAHVVCMIPLGPLHYPALFSSSNRSSTYCDSAIFIGPFVTTIEYLGVQLRCVRTLDRPVSKRFSNDLRLILVMTACG